MYRIHRFSLALLFTLLISVLITPISADAATQKVNFTGSFSGGLLGTVNFDFDITRDFSVASEFVSGAPPQNDTTGLFIRSVTSSVVSGDPIPLSSGYGYFYVPEGGRPDKLEFGSQSIRDGNGPYFVISVRGLFSSEPIVDTLVDAIAGVAEIGRPTLDSLSITVAPIPLPASALLLLGALGGTALMRRKARAA